MPTETTTQTQRDVRRLIKIIAVTDGPQKGWFYTRGMRALGLPELEIRDCPLFLGQDAMSLLNHVAQYVLDGEKPVQVGDRMGVGRGLVFAFEKLPPHDGVAKDFEVFTLSDAPMRHTCAECQGGGHLQ